MYINIFEESGWLLYEKVYLYWLLMSSVESSSLNKKCLIHLGRPYIVSLEIKSATYQNASI